MGTVCFLFSFFGIANASQTLFIDAVDQAIGANELMVEGNIEVLADYIQTIPLVNRLPMFSTEVILRLLDGLSQNATWLVRILQLNPAYIRRNPGEVLFNLILAATIAVLVRFLLQNVFRLGQHRYFMENRFQKEVPYRRTLVPFHRKHLLNVSVTMVKYHAILTLWNLTIIGGIVKHYEYRMVPYLVAENPSITWKDAKRLSSQMTKGYKWKMFLTGLSYCYMWLLELIPLVGLFTTTPLLAQLHAEEYFTLRNNPDLDRSFFTETGFDRHAYVDLENPTPVTYVLKDFELEIPHVQRKYFPPYTLKDLCAIFFCFSFAGWIWEELLTIVNHHMLVNRGFLYGPWLPIYGIGGTAMILLLDRYKENPMKLFGAGFVLCGILEYAASFLLDFIFNSSYWDYKQMLMNVNGRICLAGLIAFGIAGMFGVYIGGPIISREMNKHSSKKQLILCITLISLFVIDLICVILFGPNSGANVGGTF